ncbi:MAG: adenylate/guanylate cyclase domain-containing protein [Nitrososphaerota archaeon]
MIKLPENIVHASFFFIDIVGLSDPILSTTTQTQKIRVLNENIARCSTFVSTDPKARIFLSTGDGMVIGFLNGVDKPLKLAIEIHEKLNLYNNEKSESEKIFVRIGLAVGSVFFVDDVLGKPNFWGSGVILARRTMDVGDAYHILMTSEMAESLFELSSDYKKIIHPLHDYTIKHNQTILIYSVHSEKFGNPKKPLHGLREITKIMSELEKTNQRILYNDIEFNLILKDPTTNLIEHKKTYSLTNISDEPIFEIMHGMIIKKECTFHDLDIKAYDKDYQELQIVGINFDSPNRKEFTIKLDSPVFDTEKNYKYTVKYVIEEQFRYYENVFLINAKKFRMNFTYPTDGYAIEPKLYITDNITKEKKLLDMNPKIRKGVTTTSSWQKNDGINCDDILLLVW